MSLSSYLTHFLLERLPKKAFSVKFTQTVFWTPSGKSERKLHKQCSWSSVLEAKDQLPTKFIHVQKAKFCVWRFKSDTAVSTLPLVFVPFLL